MVGHLPKHTHRHTYTDRQTDRDRERIPNLGWSNSIIQRFGNCLCQYF